MDSSFFGQISMYIKVDIQATLPKIKIENLRPHMVNIGKV
jgi:hypothetical protein